MQCIMQCNLAARPWAVAGLLGWMASLVTLPAEGAAISLSNRIATEGTIIIARGDGNVSVTETFLPIFTEFDEVLRIPTAAGRLVDSVRFDEPQSKLLIQKNILMRATTSQADLSFVDQTFFQVPEPMGGRFLSLGLLALAPFFRSPFFRSRAATIVFGPIVAS